MPKSFGYWLDPTTNESHVVTTHQDWILKNALRLGLEAEVASLDPSRDEDLIRVIGARAGLIRIRDYGVRMSVQFHANPENVQAILRAVREFMKKLDAGPLKSVWINNLLDHREATVSASQFCELIDCGEPVFAAAK